MTNDDQDTTSYLSLAPNYSVTVTYHPGFNCTEVYFGAFYVGRYYPYTGYLKTGYEFTAKPRPFVGRELIFESEDLAREHLVKCGCEFFKLLFNPFPTKHA